ncbi:TonB-dependent receptor [Parasphingorhabdus litoris]|uniref:TonB-dependent receptor n=1 Tax=Parasphingorhabdus litoris TaxID=394733 RepID=A0ABN1ATM2_9SPHN|nr:TonB-dependent receptor [Parasphingorhabdus litoris]
MKKTGFDSWQNVFSKTLLTGTAIALAAPAYAQQSNNDDQSTESTASEIVVTGYRAQLLEAAEIERSANNVVSVITADDIGSFPDQNIGESLQRLPGLIVIRDEGEGRFITVRGLPSDFTQVTVNNAQIGSSDPDGARTVALDVIPSDLLSKVTVNKTLLPDQDHDSLGAKIDLEPLSAFSRPDSFTARLTGQVTIGEFASEIDPKIAGDITYRTDIGAGEFGIAFAGNYFERSIQLDRLESSSGGGIAERDGFAVPQELDQRLELGKRERFGASVSLDYRIGTDHVFNLSGLFGRLDDDDIRIQQEVELRDSSNSETISIGANSGRFTDVDLERLVFFQPRVEETYAIHFDGSNLISDNFRLSYAVDYSKNKFTLNDGLRGRFRERDLIVDANWDRNSADFTIAGKGDNDRPDDLDFDFRPGLDDLNYDQIFIIDESRTDEIFSYNADLEAYLNLGDYDVTLKGGFKHRMRDREFLRGEREGDPDDATGIGDLTLADVPSFVPDSALSSSGGLPDNGAFPQLEPFRDLLLRTRDALDLEAGDRRRDFTADEDTLAGYLMADVKFSEEFSIIGGVRVEHTKYDTVGDILRTVNVAEGDDDIFADQFENEESFDNEYTKWFPALHFRWEPNDQIVTRLSLYKSQVRPNFGDARALQEASFELEIPDPGGDPGRQIITYDIDGVPTEVEVESAELERGNPFLRSLTANQVDVTFGWYPNDNTSIRLAAFYKDLTNTFIGTSAGTAESIAALGFDPIDQVTGIALTEASTVINGSSGELYGVEISAEHFFSGAEGFFVTGNLTLIEASTSSDQIRDGEKFALPRQSDISGNASIGYEDEKFLVRLSGNYRSKQLVSVDGDDAFADVFTRDFLTLDLSLRMNVMDRFRIFFDASNLTGEVEERFYRGNDGPVFNRIEDFGRTFQFGVTASF